MSDRFEKIAFNADEKFDIQLGQAKAAEERFAGILQNAKLELKTETWQWERTGNICIEYARGAKPSGIAATEADYWVHELRRDGETLALIVVPMERMKAISRAAYAAGRRSKGGGDGGLSSVVKLPLAWLWR